MRKFAEEQRQKEIDEQRQREKQKFLELQGEVGLIPESSGLPTPAKEATQKTESI
jgi:succinyl-CoA synthetase beta subunit